MRQLSIFAIPTFILLWANFSTAFELNAESYYVGHPETGTVIAQHNADTLMPPASLAKLMTLYLLFEAVENELVNEDTTMSISKKAWKKGGSKMFLEVGKEVAVKDLIRGIAVSSGNDACIVAAEYLAGDEDAFADMMNRKAQALGMTNTTFRNASGWPHPEQRTTAHDMYKLAAAIVNDFPHHYGVFSEKTFTYSGIKQNNRNGLLKRSSSGVDGMKTGHTDEAGFHLVASSERNGTRLISVVMGTDSFSARENESMKGLSHGYIHYDTFNVLQAGQIVEKHAAVWMGEKEYTGLAAAKDFSLYLPKKERGKLKAEIIYDSPLPAPLAPGKEVGTILLKSGDQTWQVPLMVAEKVGKKGLIGQLGQLVTYNLGF